MYTTEELINNIFSNLFEKEVVKHRQAAQVMKWAFQAIETLLKQILDFLKYTSKPAMMAMVMVSQ